MAEPALWCDLVLNDHWKVLLVCGCWEIVPINRFLRIMGIYSGINKPLLARTNRIDTKNSSFSRKSRKINKWLITWPILTFPLPKKGETTPKQRRCHGRRKIQQFRWQNDEISSCKFYLGKKMLITNYNSIIYAISLREYILPLIIHKLNQNGNIKLYTLSAIWVRADPCYITTLIADCRKISGWMQVIFGEVCHILEMFLWVYTMKPRKWDFKCIRMTEICIDSKKSLLTWNFFRSTTNISLRRFLFRFR